MGQIACKYHPEVPARWGCRHCHINFCPGCAGQQRLERALCPICHGTLESLGAGNLITPFWRRIPRFFLYPLRSSSLLLMVALALLSAVAGRWLLGFLLQFVLAVLFARYAYAVLEHSARGHDEPPVPRPGLLTQELELPFKQLLVLFVLLLVNYAVAQFFGAVPMAVSTALIVFVLPASVMVLATAHSFMAAINPITLVRMIQRIGPPYLLLFFFLSILLVGAVSALALLDAWLAPHLYLLVNNLFDMYFVLVMFNMMGYVIYQYHEALGYQAEVEPTPLPDAAGTVGQGPAAAVDVLIKEGRFEQARAALERHLKETPGDLAAHARYQRLLRLTGDAQAAVAHAADYMARLLSSRKASEAAAVFKECHALDPSCRPRSPRQVVELAEALNARGEGRLALALLKEFHRIYPGNENVPRAYFVAARILSEKFRRDAQAASLLRFLIGQYPQHPLLPEIRRYLQVLESPV